MARKTNNSMAVAIETPTKKTLKATKPKGPKKARTPPPKGTAQRKKPAKSAIKNEEYDPAAIKEEWSALFKDPLYQEDSDADEGTKPRDTDGKAPSTPTMAFDFTLVDNTATPPPAGLATPPATPPTTATLKRKAEHLDDDEADDELAAIKIEETEVDDNLAAVKTEETEEADLAAQKAALRALPLYNAELPRLVKRAKLLFAAPTVDRYALVVPVRYHNNDDDDDENDDLWYDSDASSFCGGDSDTDEE
ncbi:hypothetical protein CONLIGDRAFT_628958 [Coniochaeta ligniaria NRRL 30616]|uniref:Uncharacterized protein n=1 Tax=Coniochaeta ligniaria NRRL 30616 TaxID=1408157 RepID=A0A1J7JX83_9PEZI|nr:hypothetical protein CONLIGDRAFT_628958 [Coniochaeta ligniaria NRRL 30616]